MALEAFIDIRFGDPVVSLTLTYQALAYGSTAGRILYYNFYSKEEKVLNEVSEEYIPGIWLSYDNTLYAAIGDQKALIVSAPEAPRPQKQYILHEKLHNSIACEYTQVKMYKDSVLLFSLSAPAEHSDSANDLASPLYVTHLADQVKQQFEGMRFPHGCVPFDFNGEKLL